MSAGKPIKTVIIHSYKGGTGKTAIAINLARYMVLKHNKIVLLVEQDTRGPSFMNIFKVEPTNFWNDFYTSNTMSFKELAIKSHDLSIICSKEGEIELPQGEDINNFYMRLLQRFKRQKNWLISEGIDYLIFDTNPGFSRELVNNLVITDTAVLITRLDTDTVTKTIEMYKQIFAQFKRREILIVQNQVPASVLNIATAEMEKDARRVLEEWKDFVKGKEVVNIPYTDEIAYTLFMNKIVPLNNPFMNYIEQIAKRI